MTGRVTALAFTVVALFGVSHAARAQTAAAPTDAVAAPAPTAPARSTSGATDRVDYIIGTDDQIVVRVADNPDLSDKPQRVDANGEIRLPMVGRVQAAGLTPEQLEASLVSRYKVFLNEPDVLVTVAESRSQPVSIVGAVGTPGVKQLDGRKTLVEMLLAAGGATADAGPTVTVRRRLDRGRIPLDSAKDDPSGQFSIAEIDLKSLLDGRAASSDFVLQPNDLISISKADMVFVIGEVGRAGPVPLLRGGSISVLEAVSTSGGILRTAAPNHARILRAAASGQARTELEIDVKKIMAGKAADVPLLAGDILVIPDSTSKRAATRAIEAAIQTGLMIGTYGILR